MKLNNPDKVFYHTLLIILILFILFFAAFMRNLFDDANLEYNAKVDSLNIEINDYKAITDSLDNIIFTYKNNNDSLIEVKSKTKIKYEVILKEIWDTTRVSNDSITKYISNKIYNK